MTIEVNKVIARIRNRDEVAFLEFYERYAGKLHGLAYSYLNDRHLAEELVQDVFLNFLKAVFGGIDIEKPVCYLIRAVIQGALRIKKKNKIRRPQPPEGLNGSYYHTGTQPEAKLAKQEERKRLWQEVNRLGDRQREVVLLRMKHDLTFEEIHEILEIPLGTALSRYHSAIKELQSRFGGWHD
ncbi:RNA polymerase sigma factor [Planctomycetota bacterium]